MTRFFAPLLLVCSVSFAAMAEDLVKLNRLYPNLKTPFPITVQIPEDGTGRQFLALQRGKILILPNDPNASEAKVFLDLSDREMEAADGKFEEGLNGLVFHPKYRENRKFYLAYTQQKPKRLVISEMKTAEDNADRAEPSTERVLLEIPLVNWNHHSGNLLFGPDGFLYIAVGDSSKRNDELRLAQNLAVLVGKILRIDVDGSDWHGGRYGIPDDNPYLDGLNAQPQIYASGLRNPWGISFDSKNRLWCADVGQDLYEEINWIVKGGNYGWSYREGRNTFVLRNEPDPVGAKFIDPVHQYDHSVGLSITGGLVYDGKAMPSFSGAYIYGDFVIGKIFALRVNDSGQVENDTLIFTSQQEQPKGPKGKSTVLVKPTAFCLNHQGELLVLDWNGGIYSMSE